jgi:hypothetical protein
MNEQEERYQVFEVIVRTAVSAYERGGMEAIQRIGIEGLEEEDLQRLCSLRMVEIRKLVNAPVFPIVAVAIGGQMELMWTLAERRKVDEQDQEELIRAGACLPLLASEYGINGEEYARLRQRLGIRSNGRPPLLTEQQELQLHELWQANLQHPSRARWLAIARAGIPLHSAWATIQKERADALFIQEKDEEGDPSSGR